MPPGARPAAGSVPGPRRKQPPGRDTGAPVVTSRLRLVQEQESNVWGVLYTIAVYGPGRLWLGAVLRVA